MKQRTMNTNCCLALLCLGGGLICLAPLFTTTESNLEVSMLRKALSSQSNRDSSVASIALVLPLLMDMITDVVNNMLRRRKPERIHRAKDSLLNNTERMIFLIGTAVVPGTTFLPSYTKNWALIYLCCQQCQFVLVGGAIAMSLCRYDKKYWPVATTYLSVMLLIIGSAFGAFTNNYLTAETAPAGAIYFMVGSWLLTIMAIAIFFVCSAKWLIANCPMIIALFNRNPAHTSKSLEKPYSPAKGSLFFPVMYILASLTATIALVVLAALSRGNENYDTQALYIHNMSFIFYLLFISYGSTRMTKYEVVKGLYALIDSKKMYVRYISHELRTPLNSACLGLKLACDELESSTEKQSVALCEILAEVKSACRTAVEILNDLLCFDKLESGILVVHKHEVPVIPFISEAVNMFTSQAREGGITMSMATPHNDLQLSTVTVDTSMCPILDGDTVFVDKFKMDQVLRNLISNALKFTPRGGSVCVSASFIPDKVNSLRPKHSSEGHLNRGRFGWYKSRPWYSLPSIPSIPLISPGLKWVVRSISHSKVHSASASIFDLESCQSDRPLQPFKPGHATEGNTGVNIPIDALYPNSSTVWNMLYVAPTPQPATLPLEAAAESKQNNMEAVIETVNTSRSSSISQGNFSFFRLLVRTSLRSTTAAPKLDMKNNSQSMSREAKRRDVEDRIRKRVHADMGLSSRIATDKLTDLNDLPHVPGTGKVSGKLVITVTDTGAGISAENQLRLFNEIVQFNPEVLQAGGGSGLGLWITNSLVNMHNGRVRVHSEGVGQGCSFSVEVDMERSSSSHAKRCSANSFVSCNSSKQSTMRISFPLESQQQRLASLKCLAKESARDLNQLTCIPWQGSVEGEGEDEETEYKDDDDDNMHPPSECNVKLDSISQDTDSLFGFSIVNPDCYDVLVVDDSSLNRKMLCRIFRTAGHTCDEAVDGLCAVERVKAKMASGEGERKAYDAVLMDFVMPNMDGPSATEIIRGLGYTGPIFGVTGNALDSDVAYFLSRGADSVLPKPFDFIQFNRLMDDMHLQQSLV